MIKDVIMRKFTLADRPPCPNSGKAAAGFQ
jgi:hypothetical protein